MAWCVECWSQDRRTVAATKILDAEDLCDPHYRKVLGEGLPAVPKNVPPMPSALDKPSVSSPAKEPFLTQRDAAERQQEKPAPPAAAAKEKKESMPNATRICACRPGCTEIAKSNASPYAKGHNPNAKKKGATPVTRNGKERQAVKNRGGQEANGNKATITVPLQASHLDALWARLSLQEKADKLFPASN